MHRLNSLHTTTFPELLKQFDLSLLVSSYQTGKVIICRADGSSLNTHFKLFNEPMGMAVDRDRLAIGTKFQVWELRNVPTVAREVEPVGKHDVCYVPRRSWVTGDIDIHEMAYIDRELWFVNTRFSCLCTLDDRYSFVPRWKPPFISAYDLQDRCHLNGFGIRDRRPAYATALGRTDTPNGWRDRKRDGGVLMDIPNNEIILDGLSMPHSPRWHRGKLWFLESGAGTLSTVDLDTQKATVVAELPGFTRGMSFFQNFAFIGLSQVRETAVFSGIPIVDRCPERNCGVWIIDIDTGQTVALLKFEDAVEEIFSVQVLSEQVYPEILETGVPFSGVNQQDVELTSLSFVLPDEALKEFSPELLEE